MINLCRGCGAPSEAEEFNFDHICKPCRQVFLNGVVPAEFWGTERDRISGIEEVLKWQPGPRGLVVCGDSGAGKSRAMWELLKDVFTPNSFVFSPGKNSFDHRLTSAYRREEGEALIEYVCDADIVAFDDITKMRMTERVESELFGVIDYRTSHKLPLIVTIQGGANSLTSAMHSEDKSGPIIRRLREFCSVVQITKVIKK